MKEKVAVATVQGKTYFLIVNELREQNIPFISIIPGESVPAKAKLVITTEQEKHLVTHERIVVFHSADALDNLIGEVKRTLLGKEAFERIVVGIDPGEVTGVAILADGKVIEEGNCYSTQEVISNITKAIRNVDFSKTDVGVKVGNGVPVHKELLNALDEALPPKVVLEVASEAGTNRPLKENRRSRRIRHISSAIHIAGRTGCIFPRRKLIAANGRIQ